MRCNQLYLSCFIFVMFPSVARVAICVEETEDEDADFLGEGIAEILRPLRTPKDVGKEG